MEKYELRITDQFYLFAPSLTLLMIIDKYWKEWTLTVSIKERESLVNMSFNKFWEKDSISMANRKGEKVITKNKSDRQTSEILDLKLAYWRSMRKGRSRGLIKSLSVGQTCQLFSTSPSHTLVMEHLLWGKICKFLFLEIKFLTWELWLMGWVLALFSCWYVHYMYITHSLESNP